MLFIFALSCLIICLWLKDFWTNTLLFADSKRCFSFIIQESHWYHLKVSYKGLCICVAYTDCIQCFFTYFPGCWEFLRINIIICIDFRIFSVSAASYDHLIKNHLFFRSVRQENRIWQVERTASIRNTSSCWGLLKASCFSHYTHLKKAKHQDLFSYLPSLLVI